MGVELWGENGVGRTYTIHVYTYLEVISVRGYTMTIVVCSVNVTRLDAVLGGIYPAWCSLNFLDL